MSKQTIGRNANIILPDFSAEKIPAKIDTGAFHSAIHADQIKISDGQLHYRLLGRYPASTTEYNTTQVASSFGDSETRYVVPLTITLGSKTLTCEFTLANRSKRTFPILIGRELLNGEFIVDPEITETNHQVINKDEEGA